ncbi:HAD-like domain-containing protein [Hygrophoropsis aurantiaca]|uniref:HAD-like domain-containing protein n=1 Tax=Hygrophoropsis aurantiaca TaxID=72124 RepID=A0ACB8A9I2_9AGAM|nr:HAD-like domain-containing protein [Hygrophoropsis aurantiaca]
MTSPHLKAVIFDIGGVVLRSPFIAIAEYEREKGIPKDYLNVSITARGSHGAWQRFERGELALFPFYDAFGRDLSDTDNGNVWYAEYCQRKGIVCPDLPGALEVDGRELFGNMMQQGMIYNDNVLLAINKIRAARKWLIIALTNNFAKHSQSEIPESELRFLGWQDGPTPPHLRALFDDFCDSSQLGMRKPEPEIYLLACERNNIRPTEAIFVDDIGLNLKAAKKLGMDTIHVPLGGDLDAMIQLEKKLGIDITSRRHSEVTVSVPKL